jgi:hypothetical protein
VNEVCFVDGCGDPGDDIVVEVTPTSTDQSYPQQFAVSPLLATEDIELYPPASIQGTLRQEANMGASLVPFTGLVAITASGEGLVLPDTVLTYQSLVAPQGGSYSLPVGSGLYTLSLYPQDVSIPPLIQDSVAVAPGATATQDFTFFSVDQLLTVSGALELSPGQPLTAGMSVQAFTSDAQPLSQRVPADGGQFSVNLSPAALQQSSYTLTFTPADVGALAPTKSFTVAATGADAGVYDLGDYGAPVAASGVVLTQEGNPVTGAAVHVEGTVAGGGSFVSPVAITNGDGGFWLTTLTSDPSSQFTLVAVPPHPSTAGILQTPVSVQSSLALGAFTCPDRVVVQGAVLSSDGVSPAVGVAVTAVPVASVLQGAPLPAGDKTTTDASGAFSLRLDPASYRIDFVGPTAVPWSSTFTQVDGSTNPVMLSPVVFSNGRQVEGTVTFASSGNAAAKSAVNAQVHYYRKVQNLGGLTRIPLAQTFTDAQGRYSVVIPTR